MKSHYIVDAMPWKSLLFGLAVALTCESVFAVPLLVNGGFEDGADGWFSATSDPDAGGWSLIPAGDPSPSGFPTGDPGQQMGTIAIADQIPLPTGDIAATLALYQPFAVPDLIQSVVLSFDMYVNDWEGQAAFTPAQHGRVDIIDATAPIFDTSAGVVANLYIGTDGGPLPAPAVHREFELTPLVAPGENYILRFYVNSNLFFLNMGIDNVAIEAVVPEPNFSPVALMIYCAGVFAVRFRRKEKGMKPWTFASRVATPRSTCDSSALRPPARSTFWCSP